MHPHSVTGYERGCFCAPFDAFVFVVEAKLSDTGFFAALNLAGCFSLLFLRASLGYSSFQLL